MIGMTRIQTPVLAPWIFTAPNYMTEIARLDNEFSSNMFDIDASAEYLLYRGEITSRLPGTDLLSFVRFGDGDDGRHRWVKVVSAPESSIVRGRGASPAATPVTVAGSRSRPWMGRETPVLPVKRAPIVLTGGAASTVETTAKFRLKRVGESMAVVVGRHSTCGFGCETWAVRDGAGLRYFVWHSGDFECPLSAHAPTAQEPITVTPGPSARVQVRVTRKVRKVKF